jgi:hypothetical protein
MTSLTMKDSLFEQLEKVFDLMITIEFSNNLISILREYGQDMNEAEINTIVADRPYDPNAFSLKFITVLVV